MITIESYTSRANACKTLLFSPELRERTYPGRPPIYYLAAALKKAGHQVLTVDVDIAGRHKFVECLRRFDPQVIGGSALSIQINEAMELMEIAKQQCPRAITVLGGNHATQAGQYLLPLHSNYLDAVIVGEGLRSIVKIADAIGNDRWTESRNDIPGLMWWEDDCLQKNEPSTAETMNEYLPEIPYYPQYDFEVLAKADGTLRRTCQIMAARGCLNACFFCESSIDSRGGSLRHERRFDPPVIAQFLEDASSSGYQAIYFDDDTFTRDQDYAVTLSKLCKKLGLVFGCHTRPDCETPGLIRELAANGCQYIFSGLESAVPEIILGANKTRDPKRYIEAYEASFAIKKEVGLPSSAFLIHGMPRRTSQSEKTAYEFDTLQDSFTSLEFAIRKLDPAYLSMNVLRFIPGVAFSKSKLFEFLRPVEGPLHGGYFDKKWLKANGCQSPCYYHPILRAFEGSGCPIPMHMTPIRCYAILEMAVSMVNVKNSEAGRNQTRIVVDPWFEERFLLANYSGHVLSYELAPLSVIDKAV